MDEKNRSSETVTVPHLMLRVQIWKLKKSFIIKLHQGIPSQRKVKLDEKGVTHALDMKFVACHI